MKYRPVRSLTSISTLALGFALMLMTLLAINVRITYAQCGGTILPNQPLVARIARIGTSCAYIFAGTSGDTISIKMIATSSTLDPWLDLKDPGGYIVATDDDSAGDHNSLIANYQLRRSGTFTIIARAYDNASMGDFEVELMTGNGSSCGGPLQGNQWQSAQIAQIGDQCEYTFTGSQGAVITIQMLKNDATLDPWLDLKDPKGIIVASDDDGYGNSDSQISGYQLRSTGSYTIIARAYNDASSGAFSLRYFEE